MLRPCSGERLPLAILTNRRPLTRPASTAAAAAAAAKKQGDISDAFASLSVGAKRDPLPDRFRQLKRELVRGREKQLADGWARLLARLRTENDVIARRRSDLIPQVDRSELEAGCSAAVRSEIKKRGVVVVRGVVPEGEARAYKEEVEGYLGRNPGTTAYPRDTPQIYELYWSAPQLKARAHPSLLGVQHQLMASLWHAAEAAPVSLHNPLTYADRLRIRQPGDATFALGPHIDGGSVERWERGGYARGGVYDRILDGEWEAHDPWDASGRADAASNLYDGLGACSVFRAWQGWLSMSRSGPREGTLLANPLAGLTTAYVLLRPFFAPVREDRKDAAFLDAANWRLVAGEDMTSDLQGASPGQAQEVTDELHPHLELGRTMVHVPEVGPGDFVAWHCDTIHSVDKVHAGRQDSSVLYIPVCPVTDSNAAYLERQREAFRQGTPGPDFPGGPGESRHLGRPTEDMLRGWTGNGDVGQQAFGLAKMRVRDGALSGERRVVARANAVLGF